MTLYFDNSLAGRPSPLVVRAMEPYYGDFWGLCSAPHHLGRKALERVKALYEPLYELLGAGDEDTFVLTSSGTEAVNQVLWSVYLNSAREKGKNHFLATATGEAPVIMGFSRLEHLGCVCKLVEVGPKGYLTVEELAEAITPRTAFLSLSWADGLTGVVQPLDEIVQLCRERDIFLHVEGSHFLGKGYVDPERPLPHALSFHGENIHGPSGTGGLLVRKGVKLAPMILGGQDQGNLRAGPLNLPGLAGLSQAASEAVQNLDFVCTEVARLRDHLETQVAQQAPGCHLFLHEQERVPTVSAMAFEGVVNEALLFYLDRDRLCANIGGGNFQQMGLLLKALGVASQLAQGGISFSLGRDTSQQEVERAIEVIVDNVKKLSAISAGLVHE